MIASDVTTAARTKLNDPSSTRWSNGTLLRYLADAVRAVASRRPELRLASGGSMAAFPTSYTASTTLPFDDAALEPLMYLVTSAALDEDSDDRANMERSLSYRNLAYQLLSGG